MLPILGPHAQAGSLSNIIGREQKKGQQRHCFLPLLWAGDRALSIPHTSLASLPGYQAGSQRAVCFSCSVGTAAASAPKQGTEARACKHFGSECMGQGWETWEVSHISQSLGKWVPQLLGYLSSSSITGLAWSIQCPIFSKPQGQSSNWFIYASIN